MANADELDKSFITAGVRSKDSITLNISIKTSNWRCIPSFKTIENLIHKIYQITGLETLIKEKLL